MEQQIKIGDKVLADAYQGDKLVNTFAGVVTAIKEDAIYVNEIRFPSSWVRPTDGSKSNCGFSLN